VGNVWIFGSRSSAHDAPNLYRYVLLGKQHSAIPASQVRLKCKRNILFLIIFTFQDMYSVPCIRLCWLLDAFRSVHNDLLLSAMHNLRSGFP
jgi:hypothetical protein